MQNTKEKNKTCMRWMPELIAIVLVIALQIWAVVMYGIIPSGDTTLYELAEVTGMGVSSAIPHHISHTYVCILSVLLSFLGNKWAVVAVMQVGLALVISILFFVILRKVCGRVSAVFFLLLVTAMPEYLTGYNVISPELLLLLIVGMILLTSELFFSDFVKCGWQRGIVGILTGAIVGVVIWLDFFGLLVWLGIVVGILLFCPKTTVVQKSITIFLVTMSAVALFLMVYRIGASGNNIAAAVWQYMQPYISEIGFRGFTYRDILSLVVALVAFILLVLPNVGVPGTRNYVMTTALIVLVGIVAFRCMNISPISYQRLENTFLLIVCCGMIQYIADAYYNRKESNKEKEEIKVSGEKQIMEAETSAEEQTSAAINYIPNPLPLPKKHVKKEIKFDYEPSPEQMNFDYELKEGEEEYDLK